jgi:uncharacterized repeat protein (TIGR01451 family)
LALAGTLACLAWAAPATAGADLRLTKTASLEPAVGGGLLTYTLAVTNDGPDAATNVIAVDALPPQVTWFSDNCVDPPPAGQIVTCSLGTIPAFNSVSVDIQVLVSPTASGIFANTATVSSITADPDPSDNTSSLVSTVAGAAVIRGGTADKVGRTPTDGIGDANVRVKARFTLPAPVNLLGSTFTIEELIAENGAGGAGELVKALGGGSLLPVTLFPRRITPVAAIYQTADGQRPTIRVELKSRPRGSASYELAITVKRTVIPNDPLLCATADPMLTPETLLTSRFRILGPGVDRQITGTGSWKCFLAEDKLRVHGSASESVGGGEPSASIITNTLTGNDIMLDASQSEDRAPGTIVSYQFWVVDQATDLTVVGPLVGATPVTVVTLPPGDYRAFVTVTDNDGFADTASRGLSVK